MDLSPELLDIAASQRGYFTAKQAIKAGYINQNHLYHVKQGHWLRIDRGVYRIPGYVDDHLADCMRWSLWSRNHQDEPQAVISGASALYYYGLLDEAPDKVHFSIVERIRKKAPGICEVSKAKLSGSDIRNDGIFLFTTPLRTLLDMRNSGMDVEELAAVCERAIGKGCISRDMAEAEKLLPALSNESGVSDGKGRAAGFLDGIAEKTWSATVKMKKRAGSTAAFTFVELLVVLSMISGMGTMLFPALEEAKTNAITTSCMNNLKQIGQGVVVYADSFDDYLVPDSSSPWAPPWGPKRLEPFMDGKATARPSTGVYRCPGIENHKPYLMDYGCNNRHVLTSEAEIRRIGEFSHPGSQLMYVDAWVPDTGQAEWRATCPQGYVSQGGGNYHTRHRGGANLLFIDTHVGWRDELSIATNPNDIWSHYGP